MSDEIYLPSKKILKLSCEKSHLAFTKYFFKERETAKFIEGLHHKLICKTLDRVIDGEIKRLVINVSPGFTKCVSKHTMITLSCGSQKLVPDVKVGDEVLSHVDGRAKPHRVIGTESFNKCCNKITTNFGRELSVSHDHPVLTQRGWVNAEDLTEEHYLIALDSEIDGTKPIKSGNLITHYQFNRLKNECDPTLSRYEKEDFHYDRVVSNVSIGEEKVYHLSVDANNYDDQNFIANGLVVHNTELAVIHFIARGLAINNRAKFIHTSYSDTLVNLNSSKTKELVFSESFQELWPMKMRSDTSGKREWYNEFGGGLYVAPSGGAITGFRAGRMEKGFTGAFICDDPLKADDAFSETKTDVMNRRFPGTYRSRLADQEIPMIVIMQRVSPNDPTAFLLNGGTGEKWHHLNLPILIDNDAEKDVYSHAIPIEHNLEDGPLWEAKFNTNQIEELKSDRFTFAAQYMQSPLSMGGNLINLSSAGRYKETPTRCANDKLTLSLDTANKDGELNDNSVCLVWLSRGPLKYLIDVWCDKVKYPILKKTTRSLIEKWQPNEVLIEDKASGQQLIQELQLQGFPNIIAIEPGNQSKVMRMANEVSPIDNGTVILPEVATWLFDFEKECKDFPSGTKDRVDAMSQYLKRERTRFEVYVG